MLSQIQGKREEEKTVKGRKAREGIPEKKEFKPMKIVERIAEKLKEKTSAEKEEAVEEKSSSVKKETIEEKSIAAKEKARSEPAKKEIPLQKQAEKTKTLVSPRAEKGKSRGEKKEALASEPEKEVSLIAKIEGELGSSKIPVPEKQPAGAHSGVLKRPDENESRTVIDLLVELVREKKRATVEELAEIMGLERGELEQLANVLEESDLIKVKYSLLHPGRTELISKEASGKANEEVKSLRERVESIDEDTMKSEQEFFEIYGDLLKRLNHIEDNLNKLEDEKQLPPEAMDFLLGETSKLEESLKSFDVKVDAFDKKLEGVRKKVARFKAEVMTTRKPSLARRLAPFIERIRRIFLKGKS